MYTQTTDRLWRKNRQPVSGITCPGGSGSGDGRDIARNWPYQWDIAIGASTDPCNEKFKGFFALVRPRPQRLCLYICPNHSSHNLGLAPGDATETSSLSSHLNKLASETGVKLYIDFHSYSQLLLSRTYVSMSRFKT